MQRRSQGLGLAVCWSGWENAEVRARGGEEGGGSTAGSHKGHPRSPSPLPSSPRSSPHPPLTRDDLWTRRGRPTRTAPTLARIIKQRCSPSPPCCSWRWRRGYLSQLALVAPRPLNNINSRYYARSESAAIAALHASCHARFPVEIDIAQVFPVSWRDRWARACGVWRVVCGVWRGVARRVASRRRGVNIDASPLNPMC